MINLLLSFVGVILFCFCCRHFIKVILTPLPTLSFSGYNRAALRVQRAYGIIAWGVMTVFFLAGLTVSFYQVYTQL